MDLVASQVLGRKVALESTSQALSLLPGLFGGYIRVAFYRKRLAACSWNSTIAFGSRFSDPRAEIGEHVYIGADCDIGWAVIGTDTLIGSGVHLVSGNMQHRFDRLDTPIRFQHGEFRRTSIGEDFWIGNGAIVMADVGSHAVVGAGSVVTKPVPEYHVVAGNPARLIRSRLGHDR
jgi:acetyltransferase-like isoleucine patch superfamily enzyme